MFLSLVVLVLVGLCIGSVTPARAQEALPSERSTCRICHENRYYLYDTGQWYCLCGKQRTCTDCHFGVDDAWDIEIAHESLVVNPIEHDATVCQDCHLEDAQDYIAKFAVVAGIDLNATPIPTPTAFVPPTLAAGEELHTASLQPQPLQTWQKLAFGGITLAFLGVIMFGYRCWQFDCGRRRETT